MNSTITTGALAKLFDTTLAGVGWRA